VPSTRCESHPSGPTAVCFYGQRADNGAREGERETDSVLFHAIGDALDDVRHDALVVPVRLVVPEAHQAPARLVWIPVDFDDAVVDLLA
jgi:hypothetical protein